jgi:heterodisulfide reductase subunit C
MAVAQAAPAAQTDPGAQFVAEVRAQTAGISRLQMCIQCGSCGGSCPSGQSMDHTPRALFALIRAGKRDEVLHSNTPWMCLSCYHCTVRCPQEIHITEVMYALKVIAERAHVYPHGRAAGFSGIFAGNVRRFGRSWDMGLTARHYIRRFPLRILGVAPMAVSLFLHRRIGIVPARIRQRGQLNAILDRADELDKNR